MITRLFVLTVISSLISCLIVSLTLVSTGEAASPQGKKATAAEFELPTPMRLTTFRHPVVYASPDVYFKKVQRKTIVRQTLIIKWGLHVFELAEGIYQCDGKPSDGWDCTWVDHTRIATYSYCEIPTEWTGKKPKCSGRLSGDSGPSSINSRVEESVIHFESGMDPDSDRRSSDGLDEFPGRHHDPENPIP